MSNPSPSSARPVFVTMPAADAAMYAAFIGLAPDLQERFRVLIESCGQSTGGGGRRLRVHPTLAPPVSAYQPEA